MTVRGGHVLRATIAKALNASGVRSVRVGWFTDARYPDGTPVARVAVVHEFGTKRHKERAVFRRALRLCEPDVREAIRLGVDTETLAVDGALAETVGAIVKAQLIREIEREKLIDTRTLVNSISVRIEGI